MGYKNFLSSWECCVCGTVHDEDDSDYEGEADCWKCEDIAREKDKKNALSTADLHKEIKQLKSQLKFVKKHNKFQIDFIMDMVIQLKMDLKNTHSQLVFVKAELERVNDELVSNKDHISCIEKNGTLLNDDNVKSIKKMARKTAIKQILKWESD